MTADRPPDPLLTVPEAAAYLRLSRSGIYRELAAGRLLGVRTACGLRLPQSTLDAYTPRLIAEATRQHDSLRRLLRPKRAG